MEATPVLSPVTVYMVKSQEKQACFITASTRWRVCFGIMRQHNPADVEKACPIPHSRKFRVQSPPFELLSEESFSIPSIELSAF